MVVMGMVEIELPKMYFDVLSRWASVGRTVDEAVELLNMMYGFLEAMKVDTEAEQQTVVDCIRELGAIKQALDAVNWACKQKRIHDELMANIVPTAAILPCEPMDGELP